MLVSSNVPIDRLTLHYIDANVKDRACFAQTVIQLGHHCELYESLHELSLHLPRQGILFVRDDPGIGGGIINAIHLLEQLGVWLSVVGVAEAPEPRRIVQSIKAGALDYLGLPLDFGRLQRCLTRISDEDKQASSLRRRRIEAQEKLGRLTSREGEVLEKLSAGLSNKAIARELGISPRTVEIHRRNMMSKLEASHAAGAVRVALEARRAFA